MNTTGPQNRISVIWAMSAAAKMVCPMDKIFTKNRISVC